MKRRTFLAMTGGLFFVPVGGCLDRVQTGANGMIIPDGMAVDTRHWVADILEEGIWYQRQQRDTSVNRYHTLIDGATAARDRIDAEESVTEFVVETDFSESYLIIVQNVMQSARWLALRRIERRELGLDISVTTVSPDEPYGDDASAHSLAIRITDEQTGTPDDIHVTIDGNPTDTRTD